jgi:replicative DNA helicase
MGKVVDLNDIKIEPSSQLAVFGGGILNSEELNLSALAKKEQVEVNSKEEVTINKENKAEEIKVNTSEVIKAEYQEECGYNIETLENLSIGSSKYLDKLANRIKDRPARISTGIKELDEVTGGGWPCGISTVAALPNLGKTTILIQSAAAMAMQGVAVVYITYDMREIDLTAKVISHTSYKLFKEDCYTISDILNKNVLGEGNDKSKAVIKEVARTQKYLHIRDLIYDPEFNAMCNTNDELKGLSNIERIFQVYCSIYKKVVFICDSLQQMAAFTKGNSGKEGVDKQLQEFKGLSTFYEVPVILISTLNRGAYNKNLEIEISGLKESGSIEYDSDLILGLLPKLQYEGKFDMTMDQFREQESRNVIIKCIKSRDSGYKQKTMTLYAPGCSFIECKETDDKPTSADKTKKIVDKKMPPNKNYS